MRTSHKICGVLSLCVLLLTACAQPASPSSTAARLLSETTVTPGALRARRIPTKAETPVVAAPQPAATARPIAPAAAIGARQHLMALAGTSSPRLPGSPEEAQAAQYILTTFKAFGYKTQVQSFPFTAEDNQDLTSANVIALKPGRSSREIIIGAHYDSPEDGQGADDNASGVAVLLAAAEEVKSIDTPYTLRFIAFGAEENDLNGSRYYVEQLSKSDIQNVVAMINLDSLIAGDIAYVYGDAGTPDSLRDWLLKTAQNQGLELEGKTAKDMDNADGTPCECADYDAFQRAGIPFVYFEATNWTLGDQDGTTQVAVNYGEHGLIRHTRFDTIDYLEATFPGRIDQHLKLFTTLLVQALTQFTAPN
ncbi:MAG: M20/M25/M40 family metallo-hydrolase [Thermoflexales bacterium]|nr:M20/M25/M40 family metallo-hydrolase [Thermoflexales bacterium]